jgi:hypothetical protein
MAHPWGLNDLVQSDAVRQNMTLYHYCSNVSFVSIIRSQSIWLSEFSLSNDALEGKWIREILSECCEDCGLRSYEATEILMEFEPVLSFLGAAGFCMSEDGDLLSQWRGYADNGQGLSLGFNVDTLNAIGASSSGVGVANVASLQKIEYDRKRQKSQIENTVGQIIDLWRRGAGRRITLLNQGNEDEEKEREKLTEEMRHEFYQMSSEIYAFKNPAFREEREWRLVSTVTPNELFLMDFRSMPDRVVPYKELRIGDFTRGAIAEVILGPKNITPDRVIRAALARYGWGLVNVRRSEASYR